MDKARLILERDCELDFHPTAGSCDGRNRTVLDPDLVLYEGYNVSPRLTVSIILDTLDVLLPVDD